MLDEPWIDLGERTDFLTRHASLKRLKQPANSVRPGNVQPLAQQRRGHLVGRAPRGAGFERTNPLAERFLKRAAKGPDFSHVFNLRTEGGIGAWEVFELPLGDFDHDVINRRFETRW